MVYPNHILHTNACEHDLTTGICNSLFMMDEDLQSIISAGRRQLVKMLITLEPHGIFGLNFAYLFIFSLSSHWYANSDDAL